MKRVRESTSEGSLGRMILAEVKEKVWAKAKERWDAGLTVGRLGAEKGAGVNAGYVDSMAIERTCLAASDSSCSYAKNSVAYSHSPSAGST